MQIIIVRESDSVKKKIIFITGFVLLAIALVALAVFCIKSDGRDSKDTKESTTNYEEIVEDSGEFTVSIVNAYEYKKYADYDAPPKGFTYYCVEVVAENVTSDPKGLFRSEFICYADGKATEQKLFNSDDFIWGDVMPGEKAGGKLYFEVPKGAKKVKVEYKNNTFDEKEGIVFNVKK